MIFAEICFVSHREDISPVCDLVRKECTKYSDPQLTWFSLDNDVEETISHPAHILDKDPVVSRICKPNSSHEERGLGTACLDRDTSRRSDSGGFLALGIELVPDNALDVFTIHQLEVQGDLRSRHSFDLLGLADWLKVHCVRNNTLDGDGEVLGDLLAVNSDNSRVVAFVFPLNVEDCQFTALYLVLHIIRLDPSVGVQSVEFYSGDVTTVLERLE